MEKQQRNLDDLKKDYLLIKEKFNLPSFDDLNNDFGIERIYQFEYDSIIREVRKVVCDKIVNYLRFCESIVNPSSQSMFIFSVVKLLNLDEKKKFSEAFMELSKKQIEMIELDLEFNEEKEAEFIKDSYSFWQDLKKEFSDLMIKIKERWKDKPETNNKGYFG